MMFVSIDTWFQKHIMISWVLTTCWVESHKLTLLMQALKEALAQIRICSRLEGLLLKKKNLSFGDSPEIHAQKVCNTQSYQASQLQRLW